MELSTSVVKKFVDLTKQDAESAGSYFYGTGIVNGDNKYVQLDGSDSVTSVSLASDLETGDRVLVYIEGHQASVIGNITYPSSGRGVIDVSNRLQDFEELVVGDFYAVSAEIEDIHSNYVSTQYLETNYLTSEYILSEYTATEELVATYATIENLAALKLYVDSIEANEITVEYLDTHYADIESLAALQATVGILEANYANIEMLLADYAKISDLEVTNENVANLTADYSDLKYVLAGYEFVEDLQSIHLTVDNVVIDNAVMETILASNAMVNDLTAGTIYTSKVRIQTDEGDTSLYLGDSLIQMSEANLVRFQAGKDATGEYGLYIWNSEGKIMFDATGATSDGIGKEVIVNDMVSDTANIAGYKLDIASVAERLNEDGSLTIEAAQVTINGSTLDAWYAEVTEATTDLGTSMTALQTQFIIVQGQVDTVVSQTEILEGEVTSLSDQYAEIVVNVNSVITQVKDLSSDYDTLTGEYTNLISQVASITTSVNNISIDVSSLTTNYSTLSSQVASINTDISSITASVSSVESQLSSAVIWNMCSGTSDDWTSYKVADGSNKTVYPLKFYEMNDAGLSVGDVIYVSFDVKYSDDFVASGTDTAGYGYIQGDCNTGGTWVSISMTGGNQKTNLQSIATGERIGHISTYFKVTSAMIDGTYSGDWRVGFRFDYVTGTFYYKCAMANVGSSAATWNPSREDVADSVSEESVIEILKNNITLKTSSSSNGTASIILSVDGESEGTATVVTDARTAFANESSSITISAGTITFNSGTLIVNSGNFTLDSEGNITANSGNIGGWTIGDASLYNGLYSRDEYANVFGTYIGTDGITQSSSKGYFTDISNGSIRTNYLNIVDDINDTNSWSSLHLTNKSLSWYYARTIATNGDITNGGYIGVNGNYDGITLSDYDEYTYYNEGYSGLSFLNLNNGLAYMGGNNGLLLSDCVEFPWGTRSNLIGKAYLELSGNYVYTSRILSAENSTSSTSTEIRAHSNWGGYTVSLQVGSGGSNRGVYDNTAGSWMIYSDSSNHVHVYSESLTYSGTTYGYRVGNIVWISIYGMSASDALSMLGGIGVSPRRSCSFPLLFLNGNTGYMYVGYARYLSSSWAIMVAPSYAGSPASGSNYSGSFYGVITFTLS